jgi:hypothetical protein
MRPFSPTLLFTFILYLEFMDTLLLTFSAGLHAHMKVPWTSLFAKFLCLQCCFGGLEIFFFFFLLKINGIVWGL